MNLEIEKYRSFFLAYLDDYLDASRKPKNLYEPIAYILNLGGKRLRPSLTLMSCELFGGIKENALDAALAIEMFHNFSLVHDDIMDDAPIRRGKQTVHEKWNLNTGILSGDAMLVLANQLFESYTNKLYKELIVLFNKTALEVCEGQQLDFDFETRMDVSVEEYLEMIRLKTAVLVATSLKFGAMIANASQKDLEYIYQFGIDLGIAFQLQDDYLDVFGAEDFGKQQAGDITENKKTILFLKTVELANTEDKTILKSLYKTTSYSQEKIEKVTQFYLAYQIPQLMEKEIANYTEKAVKNIDRTSLSAGAKKLFKTFALQLMNRKV